MKGISYISKFFVAYTALWFLFGIASGQVLQRQIHWQEPVSTRISDKETVTSLFFDGAVYDENVLPVYRENIPAGTVSQNPEIRLTNTVYEKLDEQNLIPEKTNISESARVNYEIVFQQVVCVTSSDVKYMLSIRNAGCVN